MSNNISNNNGVIHIDHLVSSLSGTSGTDVIVDSANNISIKNFSPIFNSSTLSKVRKVSGAAETKGVIKITITAANSSTFAFDFEEAGYGGSNLVRIVHNTDASNGTAALITASLVKQIEYLTRATCSVSSSVITVTAGEGAPILRVGGATGNIAVATTGSGTTAPVEAVNLGSQLKDTVWSSLHPSLTNTASYTTWFFQFSTPDSNTLGATRSTPKSALIIADEAEAQFSVFESDLDTALGL